MLKNFSDIFPKVDDKKKKFDEMEALFNSTYKSSFLKFIISIISYEFWNKLYFNSLSKFSILSLI